MLNKYQDNCAGQASQAQGNPYRGFDVLEVKPPSNSIEQLLLDRLIAAELRVAHVSRDRAEIASELEDLKEAYNELDERNTTLHIQHVATENNLLELGELRARVAELSVGGHVEVIYPRGVLEPLRMTVNSVSSANGKTTIHVKWPTI